MVYTIDVLLCSCCAILSFHVGVKVSFKIDGYTYLENDGEAGAEVILMGQTAVDVVVLVMGGMF